MVATTGNPAATTALAVATSQAFGSRRGAPGRCSDRSRSHRLCSSVSVRGACDEPTPPLDAATALARDNAARPCSTPTGHRGLLDRVSERDALEQLVAGVRAGQSRVLVLRGEAGVGKTALLRHLSAAADGCRIARAAGVESEMELAFAGLHALCAPMLGRLGHLPSPQRDALSTAFGLSAGPPPDRFLVGLAVLSLLADAAEEQPLVCIVDDAQWLDRVSAQTLAFVARRLLAERVGLVFALRESGDGHALEGLPELRDRGAAPPTTPELLLDATIPGPLDERVKARILDETRGNPLALIELPRGLTPAELAGGFGLPDARRLASRIEHTFLQRVQALPRDAQLLLLTAAAEPLGDLEPAVARRRAARDRRRRRAAGGGRRVDRARRCACASRIRSSARRSTARRTRATAATCTRRSRRRPTRCSIPTGARGIARTRRRRPTRRWPRSWRARPTARSAAAGWRRPPRSCSARPS